MKLKILLPTGVLVDEEATKVTLEAADGEMTLLPGHIDMTSPLVPGVLSYQTADGEQFVAVAEGILTVVGDEVLVSVRKGVQGAELGQLRERIDEEFRKRDEHEQTARVALNKIEATFVHRFIELGHD